jgi:acyl carrier protein
MEQELRDEIRGIIALHLDRPESEITDDVDLVEELGVDSLDYLDVITRLDMAYKVDIDLFEDTQGRLKTVRGLAEHIAARTTTA